MLRKTTCAAGGLALACAAVYLLSLLGQSSDATSLDLRWLYPQAKEDRLPVTRASSADQVTVFEFPSRRTTIVTKEPVRPVMESAVQKPRTKVRTIRIQPVREVPNEEPKKDKLPEGCEPAFSPVTMPSLAHISVRCDS